MIFKTSALKKKYNQDMNNYLKWKVSILDQVKPKSFFML